MNAGKMFSALPIAFFRMFFTCFVVVSLTNLVSHQNNLTSLLSASFMPLLFLLILAGTIMLIRHLKTKSRFGINNLNIKLEHVEKKTEVVRYT